MPIYRYLSDAGLLVEARARIGLDALIELMGWSSRSAYDTDVSRCLSGDRRYSDEQRAKLIEAIRTHPVRPDEKERDELSDELRELNRKVDALASGRRGARRKG